MTVILLSTITATSLPRSTAMLRTPSRFRHGFGSGKVIESPLAISPRAWNIERVNLARPTGAASEAFMQRRRPELAQINAAA